MSSLKISTLAVCSILLQAKGILCWPEEMYGLPMTKSGCPENEGFSWFTGSRTHQTEDGSFCSDSSHFPGTCPSESQAADRITQYFCIKNSYASAQDYKWEAGQYCIYKVDKTCPTGFKEGSLHWDDNVDIKYEILDHPVQTTIGYLPEGEYDRNTEIEYCCRGDGVVTKPIHLPTELPFYLVRLGTDCQEVKDMSFHVESIQWSGDHTADFDSGIHPLHTRTTRYSRVYYCYYEEEKKSTTFKTVLIAVLGVVAAIIFIAIIVFIIQRFLAIKKLKALEEAENNNTDPMMVDNKKRGKELSVIYKPGRGKKNPTTPSDEEGGLLPSAPRSSRPESQPPSYDDVVGQES